MAKVVRTSQFEKKSIPILHQWNSLYQKWPVEPAREGRSMRDFLQKRIQRMSKGDVKSADQSQSLKAELKYAQDVLQNKYVNQYPQPQSWRPVHREAYPLLSNEARSSKISSVSLFIPVMTASLKHRFRNMKKDIFG
ncbi:hypothetical protein MIR68_005993 [Amoeboaphelidium protococcarum]|nr:hypothetical protein MIR68_005993 [Amoeboaphelidium protococcarum]